MKKSTIWIWAVLFMLLFVVSGCSLLNADKNIKELTINRNLENGADNSKQTTDQSYIDDLTELVNNNTITQKQADAVVKALGNQQPGMRNLTILVGNGTITKAQAETINKITNTRLSKPFAQLVKEGSITQAQADAIIKAMRPTADGRPNISEAVAKLMNSGTLNQSQANAIIKASSAGRSLPAN